MPRFLREVATLIQQALDVVLPRKSRVVRVHDYRLEDIPVAPQEHEACGIHITTLMQYREKAVEDTIRALKYDASPRAAQILADILAEYLREEIASIRSFSSKPVILVPVPLHPNRERERGFNQISTVLGRLPLEYRDGSLATIGETIITRTRETLPQVSLSRDARLENVANAFAFNDLDGIFDAHIFIIDDVTTTGATLCEAAKPFQSLNIPLTLLALAHA